MFNEEVWINVEKVVFVAELISKIGYRIYMVQKEADNFQVGLGEKFGKLKYDCGNLEYEIDEDIGAYRFRDKRCGPWTKWRSCEG